jgi:hypothetical protein
MLAIGGGVMLKKLSRFLLKDFDTKTLVMLHEAEAERDRYREALRKIVEHNRIIVEDYGEIDGPHTLLAQHARDALEAGQDKLSGVKP